MDYRKWPVKYRLLALLIVFILSVFFFATKVHAEETVGDHVKEAVFDTLAGVVAVAGAAEQAVTGNLVTGAILSSLAAREFVEAYKETREAWNMYRSNDDDRNDRDISPAEAKLEHGRD